MNYYQPYNYNLDLRYQKLNKKKSFKRDINIIGLGMLFFTAYLMSVGFIFQIPLFLFGPPFINENVDFDFMQAVYYACNDSIAIPAMFFSGVLILSGLSLRHNDVINFKFNKPKKVVMALIPISFVFFMVANNIIEMFLNNLSSIGLDFSTDLAFNIKYSGNILDNILYLIFLAIVPAIVEEYLFRGVVLGSLRKYGDGFAILFSAILFGFMHGNIVQIPFAFIGGLLLGYITVYSNSIIPAMIVHFLNNGFSVVSDIIMNEYGENVVIIVTVAVLIITIIISLFCLKFLANFDKDIFKLKKHFDSLLSFKEKVKASLTTPSIIVFLIYNVINIILMCLILSVANTVS